MPRRADRYHLRLSVELTLDGQRVWVALQDLSRTGMFLQMTRALPVATQVRIAITVDGRRFGTSARVTHRIEQREASERGRYPGVGIAFCEPTSAHDHLFALAIERLVRAQRERAPATSMQLVLADADTGVLEQMSSALGDAGFAVATASNGMETMAACLRRTPDVIVLARDLPVFDGFRVLDTLVADPRFAGVPVIITSADLGDLAPAFDHGARDFLARPFSALEVIVRARRLVQDHPRGGERIVLRGSLADVSLAAVLTLLELERKTGRLTLTHERSAWIDVAAGRIIDAGVAEGAERALEPRHLLRTLLAWQHGTFTLSADLAARPAVLLDRPAAPLDRPLDLAITPLLLEHARQADEATRPIVRRPGSLHDHPAVA